MRNRRRSRSVPKPPPPPIQDSNRFTPIILAALVLSIITLFVAYRSVVMIIWEQEIAIAEIKEALRSVAPMILYGSPILAVCCFICGYRLRIRAERNRMRNQILDQYHHQYGY